MSSMARAGRKSLRLYKGALSLLHWLHPAAYGYYMDSFWEHHFPGDAAHRDRNHRVAEAVALCMSAGVEVLPYDLPRLQRGEIRKVTPAFPSLYLGRGIKKAFPGEEKKTLFTRAVGALLYLGGCYAVYNARNAAMKWRGHGGSSRPSTACLKLPGSTAGWSGWTLPCFWGSPTRWRWRLWPPPSRSVASFALTESIPTSISSP